MLCMENKKNNNFINIIKDADVHKVKTKIAMKYIDTKIKTIKCML